ncbi:MAG: type II toxin-antitoxin system RelE/ParE family toxin [Treponema sp.]|nr:type II toxin-antitoxin system RelE/ParE family toxin [Treponema sp.]
MKIVYTEKVLKQLKKLDKSVSSRIVDYMDEVAKLEAPRSRGKSLVGNLIGLWRYRVGDYRILCRIIDDELVIMVVEIGHRKGIYSS